MNNKLSDSELNNLLAFYKKVCGVHDTQNPLMKTKQQQNWQERLEQTIDDCFRLFVQHYCVEPEYVCCQIIFDGEPEDVIIKLNSFIDENTDDRVFFYCNSLEEFKLRIKLGKNEFVVIDSYRMFAVVNGEVLE